MTVDSEQEGRDESKDVVKYREQERPWPGGQKGWAAEKDRMGWTTGKRGWTIEKRD